MDLKRSKAIMEQLGLLRQAELFWLLRLSKEVRMSMTILRAATLL